MDEGAFVDLVGRRRAIAILRTTTPELAFVAMDAAVSGGCSVIEFTLNTPGALELIRSFRKRAGIVVGAGTVLTRNDVVASVSAGAEFLVSPVFDPVLLQEAQRLHVPLIPGTHTPTEMWRALQAGCPVVKLFPAPGPDYVRYCLGPMPDLRIVPTSGVDEKTAAAFLQAGAFALGLGSALFPADAVLRKDAKAITRRARSLLRIVADAERVAKAPGVRPKRRTR